MQVNSTLAYCFQSQITTKKLNPHKPVVSLSTFPSHVPQQWRQFAAWPAVWAAHVYRWRQLCIRHNCDDAPVGRESQNWRSNPPKRRAFLPRQASDPPERPCPRRPVDSRPFRYLSCPENGAIFFHSRFRRTKKKSALWALGEWMDLEPSPKTWKAARVVLHGGYLR